MAVFDRVWSALTAMVRLEDKVKGQSEAIKSQQSRIESLTERVIRLEARLDTIVEMAQIATQKRVS